MAILSFVAVQCLHSFHSFFFFVLEGYLASNLIHEPERKSAYCYLLSQNILFINLIQKFCMRRPVGGR